MFVDKAKIKIKAGDGGNGSVSFHREKYVAAGGPDGGDGGKGGNVVFVVNTNLSTLIDFKYKKNYEAENGGDGIAKKCSGKNGKDLIISVPQGTLVKDAESGRVIADMSTEEPKIIARGGNGGWGNTHFATATRQIPRFAKGGIPGECFEVVLELKLLADVGLVGFPNVGKSTLISVISAAKPKIANYHFTTLTPVLGVVKVENEKSFVVADIPGLIEGASEGVGLGHEFLRHIERCRMIVHVVDVSGIEGRNPEEDFVAINNELRSFNEELASRPMIVVANKADMATKEQINDFKKYIEDQGLSFFVMSAATKKGTSELVYAIWNILKDLPPIKQYEEEPVAVYEMDKKRNKDFDVRKENGVYMVEAPWLLRVLSNVNMDDYESLQYFQMTLRSSGIIKKLEEMGINEGDTVSIYGFEFDYIR